MADKKPDVKTYFKEYCEYSSIPGVRYLVEDRPIFEKVLWITGLMLSLVTCIYLIAESWELRNSNPVILAMDKYQQPVWDIPFPAVTICPFQKTKGTVNDIEELMCAYDMLCERDMTCDVSETIDFLEKFSLDPNDVFVRGLFYIGENAETIKPVLINDGMCFTVNMLPGPLLFAEDTFHRNRSYLNVEEPFLWDEEKGYFSKEYDKAYPRRVLPGLGKGLLTILQINRSLEKDDLEVTKPCQHLRGFMVKIHNALDIPSGDITHYITAPSNARITVQPKQLTSDDLRSYSPAQRQCYYRDEKKLDFFKVYSRHNCEVECASKIALECCDCVAYHMPRKLSTPVCNTSDQALCIRGAQEKVRLEESHLKYQGYCNTSKISCNCLPSCLSLTYDSRVSQVALDSKRLRYVLNTTYVEIDEKEFDYIVLEILYTESHFVPYRRMEMYGTVEFISNIGGLLGLFLGFCAMSLVEFVYWLVMRPLLCLRPMPLTDLSTEELEMQLIIPPRPLSEGQHSPYLIKASNQKGEG